ncbi:DUF4145 domain-containing protein [Gluconobacter kondonii]|uniref:DUF4145 domain-containing protein n=1 Tax=Gluconobacter kondonii TaxID=941463 RepID=UPI001B8BCAA6|nr:DUF4145 domain-containing protein [Gluconobacter kondonii]MBS1083478.1 DUF4145 domain-containing protein [Gluconobacter kondonii]
MMETKIGSDVLVCPQCKIPAQQIWSAVMARDVSGQIAKKSFLQYEVGLKSFVSVYSDTNKDSIFYISKESRNGYCAPGLYISKCTSCNRFSVWGCDDEVVYPKPNRFNPPSDLPPECLKDFEEACAVSSDSPRAGAALLRACLEKLLFIVTGKNNPNDAIKFLVKMDVDHKVQEALDVVRVTGNKALHGYEIAKEGDNAASFESLVRLLEYIVQTQITQPKRVREMYENLPQAELAKIEKRDAPHKVKEG